MTCGVDICLIKTFVWIKSVWKKSASLQLMIWKKFVGMIFMVPLVS